MFGPSMAQKLLTCIGYPHDRAPPIGGLGLVRKDYQRQAQPRPSASSSGAKGKATWPSTSGSGLSTESSGRCVLTMGAVLGLRGVLGVPLLVPTFLTSITRVRQSADTRPVGARPRCFNVRVEWPLLDSLSTSERDQLLARTLRRNYPRGEVVVREGDPSDSLHLVEGGRLAVRVDTPAGDTAMLSVLGPGDWFGELSLLGSGAPVRTATVVALEGATTRALSTVAFADLRRRHPATGELLLTLLSRRIEDLTSRLVEAMYDGLDRRVYRRLLDLIRTYRVDGTGHPVMIPVTQEQLSELVGGTRPSVNQVLQRLAQQGVVELGRGRISVHQPDELVRRVR
jgi:CRP/FNR family cyclic AMP-dependent transcriptional regulator